MTSIKTTTLQEFNEAHYRDELVKAGLAYDDAVALASKTAKIQAEAVEDATFQLGLIKSGMNPARAEQTAKTSRKFYSNSQVAPGRTSGFQSVGDFFDNPTLPEQSPADALAAQREQAAADALAKHRADALAALEASPKPVSAPKPLTKTQEKRAASMTPMSAVFDYKNGELPERVRDLIQAHLAIEEQDAKSAGALGFMARSLAIATLPHRKTSDFRFVRKNGDYTLTMMTAHPDGLPYGRLPRLLLTWVCTEVVQKKERVLWLGDNLVGYLAELGLHASGGKRGDITRLKHAMTTLFSSVISCHYAGKDSFALQNVLLADKVDWWTPQNPEEAGEWRSSLMLSEPFFKECQDHVLPFDMRAIKSLGSSPLAFDIYVWLTYRMSYLSRRTIIPWVALAGQLGSGYALTDQGLRDFRRAFIRELKHILVVYPQAKVAPSDNGLVLYPSPPHVAYKSTPIQKRLNF